MIIINVKDNEARPEKPSYVRSKNIGARNGSAVGTHSLRFSRDASFRLSNRHSVTETLSCAPTQWPLVGLDPYIQLPNTYGNTTGTWSVLFHLAPKLNIPAMELAGPADPPARGLALGLWAARGEADTGDLCVGERLVSRRRSVMKLRSAAAHTWTVQSADPLKSQTLLGLAASAARGLERARGLLLPPVGVEGAGRYPEENSAVTLSVCSTKPCSMKLPFCMSRQHEQTFRPHQHVRHAGTHTPERTQAESRQELFQCVRSSHVPIHCTMSQAMTLMSAEPE